ncbi:MAG: F0F1 ATP synthase subunit A [Lachnospiraceae bacterium]|nr:F0F1 ATP synthase subunit A [Lachnospiraceae bacterium]
MSVNNSLLLADSGVNIGVDGLLKYKLFGHTFYLTNTHVSLLIVMLVFMVFAIAANIAIRRTDPYGKPSLFVSIVEQITETFDNLVKTNMGEKHGLKFSNYIGTLFMFLIISNISGLFGLRPPTADYGVTLGLALVTFILIHWNGFKYQKLKHITDLFKPVILTPINIIGEISTPLSMSLRLFGNILSGTVMMGLIYGLLPKMALWFWPGALHAYFDLFSGCIQTYVFCMLTMVFISQNFED